MYNEQSEDKRRRRLIILILLLLLLIVFGLVTLYKTGTLSKVFSSNKEKYLGNPVIEKIEDKWEKNILSKVIQDPKTDGKISYYEYCINETKDTNNCDWVRTTTKSVELSKTGKYYVSFRAVLEDGRISKPSTPELAKIDNANPKIEKVDKLEITENSIKVYVHAVDNESGVSKYLYSLDGINYNEGNKEYTFTGLNENTEYEIYVKVVDEVGNEIVVIETVKTSKKEEIKEDTPKNNDKKDDNKKDDNKKEDNKEEEKKGEEKEPENPEEPKEPELPEEPEWDMPTISLKDVPGFMVKGSSYKLPSDYDFGNDTGTVSCDVEGKKYTDTKDIDLGRYTIKCEAISSHNKKAEAEKEVLIEEEDIYDEPTIDLDDVPEVITIGDSYTLPSHYDFGNDTGTVKCVVGDVEYTNTSELEVGTYKIECTATSSHNKEAKAEKEIEVEPVWDTPLIDLDDVPDLITIGDEYILPSHYDFGNDTGVVKCVVGETEYTNTSELEVGTHKIECTATSSHNKEAKAEKEIEVEPVWDIPLINLDEVPLKFTYGDSYDLPSFYDFGNDTGTVECIVEGKRYTNTSEIKTGKHKIVCNAKSSHNKRTMVEKDVEIEYSVELDEEFDGWIKLNLYYPEGSTNWEWRLGEEEKIRTGYDNDGWMPYVEPILVRLDDIDDIYIRYDMEGVTYIIAPKGKITVDIEPDSWSLLEGQETNVRITYDKTATVKEYRINKGEWKTYEGKFKVGPDTLIEARAGRIDKVYNNLGEFQYDQTVTKMDRAYISKYIPEEYVPSGTSVPTRRMALSSDYVQEQEYSYVTTPSEPYNPPEVLEGPTITGDPTELTLENVTITITTEYPARKIYYNEGGGKYKEYTGPFEVSENKTIKAYYIRESDGLQSKTSYYYVENIKEPSKPYIKFKTTPGRYITDEIEKVEVEIIGTDCDSLEYSYDGVIYSEYTGKIEVRESKTIYARGKNENGETIESVVITTRIPPKEKEELSIMITTNPDSKDVTGLINKATVTIDYDTKATKKYYRLNYYGSWIEYTGPFEVNENTTVYAYCTSENGIGEAELSINFLTTGISSPKITIDPNEPVPQVLVEIEYNKNAEEKKYKIGSGEWEDYDGPFYVFENTTIYAYNSDILGNEAESRKTIKNIKGEPSYYSVDKGAYYIIKLNYPEVSDVNTREYKWKEDGTWKLYDKKGILLIKAEFREEIEAMTTLDGIKVEDENGEEIIFEDHYYILDVPLTELSENLFMRWSNEKPVAPVITINPSDEPTREVDVIITYAETLLKKYYKVVTADGDSGWKVYEGPFKVDRNCTIYAKGMNRIEIESKIGTKKIENIDDEAPTIDLKADLVNPKQKVIVNVIARDDLEVDIVKYAKGSQNEEYFKGNGNLVLNNGQVVITENGIYTFYAKDKVGNEVVEEIEVTNIDLSAPDVTITNNTTGFGLSSTMEIDFGDSSLKQYSIGNENNYVNYTGEFTIKASDVYNLANPDGSLTIYAKGKDLAGNITVVSEVIYNLDLDMPKDPVIQASSGYPKLTEYGIKYDDLLTVTYDNRSDIINYIDTGDGWKVYDGTQHANSGTIKAKSVKKTTGLETKVVTKTISIPSDAIGETAYDGNESTYAYYGGVRYIYVSNELWGSKLSIKGSNSRITPNIKFLDSNNNALLSSTSYGSFTIPENTVKIAIDTYRYIESYYWNYITEIRLLDEPVINVESIYPKITEYGVERAYNNITVNYYKTSVKKQYKIDDGNWKDYDGKIKLELGKTIYTKGIDKNGRETYVVSYKSVLKSDAIGEAAYDGNESSYTYYDGWKYIAVSENIWGSRLNIKGSNSRITPGIKFYDSNNNELLSSTSYGTFTVPENTTKIGISSYKYVESYYWNYTYEIRLLDEPVINVQKIYPTLTANGVRKGYSKVSITYYKTSVQRLYSYDNENWMNYEDNVIDLELGKTIYTKGIDKNGKSTRVTSYKSELPSDAITAEAYDGNNSTYTYYGGWRFIYISEELWGAKVKIHGGYSRTAPNINFLDYNNNDLTKYTYYGTFTIPEGATKIGITTRSVSESYYWNYLYEISIVN